MEKIYKQRVYRILVNMVFGATLSAFVAFILGGWFDAPKNYLIGGAVFILYVWLVILDKFISIHVNGNDLTIKKKGKVKYQFQIDQCSFKAKTKSSSGDTECYLTVIDADGEKTEIDCELIGVTKFHELVDDLGRIIGDKAGVTKLTTNMK